MIKTIHTIVFQAGEGGGNPCPVTLDADALSTEQMQAMTLQFGQEAAFIMKPTRSDCDVRVRYFLPLHETDMCMHATIGSATVLIQSGILKRSPIMYQTNVGRMRIDWAWNGGKIDVCVEQFKPIWQEDNPDAKEVCRALRVTEEALAGGPIQSVSTSRCKLIIPLAGKQTLDSLEPDYDYLWNVCDRYQTTGFYPFVIGTGMENELTLYARQFPNRAGYNEDPATGVAAAALAAYLTRYGASQAKEGWNSYTVIQGEAMGRPSRIYADTFVEDGIITACRVRGNADMM